MSQPAVVAPGVSESVRELVTKYLKRREQENIEKNLAELLDIEGGFVERFQFFMPRVDDSAKERVLISGCSAGSEFYVCKKNGFRKIVGTEVEPELVEICKQRLGTEPDCSVDLVDGTTLPYPDNSFSMIYSGHVIEHSADPYLYFKEHWRVLRQGGYFFLEFPNRYHHTELHTGLPSFEWLPRPLRNLCLRIRELPIVTRDPQERKRYEAVRTTLSQVSVRQILKYLKRIGLPTSKIVALEIPVPGFMRALLVK